MFIVMKNWSFECAWFYYVFQMVGGWQWRYLVWRCSKSYQAATTQTNLVSRMNYLLVLVSSGIVLKVCKLINTFLLSYWQEQCSFSPQRLRFLKGLAAREWRMWIFLLVPHLRSSSTTWSWSCRRPVQVPEGPSHTSHLRVRTQLSKMLIPVAAMWFQHPELRCNSTSELQMPACYFGRTD